MEKQPNNSRRAYLGSCATIGLAITGGAALWLHRSETALKSVNARPSHGRDLDRLDLQIDDQNGIIRVPESGSLTFEPGEKYRDCERLTYRSETLGKCLSLSSHTKQQKEHRVQRWNRSIVQLIVETEFDFVIAGVNDGPNIRNYVVGRSGTVGACIEAAFLDVPGIAVSAYHSQDYHCYPADQYEFNQPAVITRELLEQLTSTDLSTEIGFLNVNAPVDRASPPLRLTRLVADYAQRVDFETNDPSLNEGYHESIPDRDAGQPNLDGTKVKLVDKTWPHVDGYENPLHEATQYQDHYPETSDRRALIDGAVSISPLSLTHSYIESPALTTLIESINGT